MECHRRTIPVFKPHDRIVIIDQRGSRNILEPQAAVGAFTGSAGAKEHHCLSIQEKALFRHARMCGFVPWKILRIRTVERKPVSRLIVQFGRKGKFGDSPQEELLTLLNERGRRTSQQVSLVTDYYL